MVGVGKGVGARGGGEGWVRGGCGGVGRGSDSGITTTY